MKKRRWWAVLASVLAGSGAAGSGAAWGQGYYPAYPPAYPVMTVSGAPIAAPQPAANVLQGMPGGYATPYQPNLGRASVGEGPRLLGWPPPPGSIPPPPVPPGVQVRFAPQPALATPPLVEGDSRGRLVPIPVTTGAAPPPGSGIAPVSKIVPVPAPVAGPPPQPMLLPETYTPSSRHKAGWQPPPLPGDCNNCQPAPGQVLPYAGGPCPPDPCQPHPCQPMVNPCPGTPLMCLQYVPAPQPFVYPLPERAPRGYCGYGKVEALYYVVETQNSPLLFGFANLRGFYTVDAAELDNGERGGARSTFGFWVNPQNTLALEMSLMALAERSPGFITNGPTIVRPFINANTGLPALLTVAAPGFATGGINAQTSMEFFQGEVNSRYQVFGFKGGHVDFLAGFKYAKLEEELNVSTSTIPAAGGYLLTSDRFDTENDFIGGLLGVEGEFCIKRWSINPWAKCAVGQVRQYVTVAGNRVGPDVNGVARSVPGGFLALPSNIGTYRQNEFCFIPEAGVNFGFQVTPHLRFTVGYTALYLSNVARPGDQIDTRLNLTQLQAPGGPPAVPVGTLSPFINNINDSSLWAHGASVGLEVRW